MSGRQAKKQRRAKQLEQVNPALRPQKWKTGIAAAGLVTGALVPMTGWALPQDGRVSAGSATISSPAVTQLYANRGRITFGRISRAMIRRLVAPMTLAAATNSRLA